MTSPHQKTETPTASQSPSRKGRNKIIVAAIAVGLAGAVYAAMRSGVLMQVMGHNAGQSMHEHGADGTGHDMVNMPGLRGKYATDDESAELAVLFRNFNAITREVTNLENGIRTVTFSQDEDIMNTVVTHVVGMITRVKEGRDPEIIIQSPTLDLLFERRARITTEIETTDAGIVVTQTSDDPELVAALQTHAAEVSGMVDRGMEFVHDAMANRMSN